MNKKIIDLGKVVGDSAYELAVKNGFKGTLSEYLASLVGKNGRDGIDGNPGKDGTNGIDGEQGPEGPRGPQGVPGERGQSIDFKGALTSPDNLPTEAIKDGDAYLIDTQLYVWLEESHEWIKSGSIQGPQGIQGEQGIQGKQGIPGIHGRDGKDGVNGVDGKNGIDGKKGLDGKDGVNGVDGKNGLSYRTVMAYADSNDGTVNFTEKYPAYNLLDNSNFAKTLTVSGSVTTAFNGLPSNVVGQVFTPKNNIGNNADLTIGVAYMKNLGLAPNQKITVSVVLTNNSSQAGLFQFITMTDNATVDTGKPIMVNGITVPWESTNINPRFTVTVPGGTSMRYAFTFTVENFDKAKAGQFIILRDTTTQSGPTVLSYSKVKMELGDKPTAWVGARGENDFGDWPTFIGISVRVDGDVSQKTPADYVWSRLRGAQGAVGPKGEVGGGLPLLRGQIVTTSLITEKTETNPGEPVPDYPYAMVAIELTIPEDVYKPGEYKLIGFGTGADDGMTLTSGFPSYDRDTGKYIDITQDNPWPLRPMDRHATFNPMSYKGTALTTAVTIEQATAINLAMIMPHGPGTLDAFNPAAIVQYPDGTNHMFKLDSVFKPSIADPGRIGMIKPSEGSFHVDQSGNLQFDVSVMPVKLSVIHDTKDDSYFIHMTDAIFTSYSPDDMPRQKEDVAVPVTINMINQNSEFVSSSDGDLTFMEATNVDSVHITLHPYKEKYRDGEFEKVNGLHLDASTMIKSIQVSDLEFKNVIVSYREIIK